jgi:hypothetical protein
MRQLLYLLLIPILIRPWYESNMQHSRVLLPLPLLVTACIASVVDPPAETGDDTAASSSGAEDAATLPLPSTTALPEPGSSSTDGGEAESSSTGPEGPGLGEPCHMHVQDCAAGLKCMPYSTDGSWWWNATACFPIVPDAQDLGEPCRWFGSPWSGYDDCGWGQVCWTLGDDETGECKGLCLTDDPDAGNYDNYDMYTCEDPHAIPNIGCQDCFCVCETPCDPLGQNCGDGQECIPLGNLFQCVPDASGDMGAYGDPCEFINVCDPGLVCLGAEAVPGGCGGAFGCCTPLCDVTQPNTCPGAAEGQICQRWYEPGEAPVGLENVGVCTVPL